MQLLHGLPPSFVDKDGRTDVASIWTAENARRDALTSGKKRSVRMSERT
jgi:hypothetical protein